MGSDHNKYNTSVADYELWALAHREKEASKTPSFVTLSAIVHATALIFFAFMAVPVSEEIKTETITVEIEEIKPLRQFSRGVDVPETQAAAAPAVEAAKVAEKISAEDVVLPAAKLPEKVVPIKAIAKEAAPKKAAAPAPPKVAAKTNFKAVPMTIDDIEAPQLENGDYAKTPVASADLSDDLNKDFSKVDQDHADELENEKRDMDTMAEAIATEQNENLNGLEQDNEAEQERLNQAQESLRQQNAAAVASALASEKAESDAAARQAAARKAQQGQGTGNNEHKIKKSTAVAGVPTGVRSLDQLRQMPGNPSPKYDTPERLRGDKGEIAFVAYISKDGYPSQFKLMKSTGYRNLDAKTLSALKKWRFYPGQEGWVELPFRWDLKGGVQEDGGLLRRAVSSR